MCRVSICWACVNTQLRAEVINGTNSRQHETTEEAKVLGNIIKHVQLSAVGDKKMLSPTRQLRTVLHQINKGANYRQSTSITLQNKLSFNHLHQFLNHGQYCQHNRKQSRAEPEINPIRREYERASPRHIICCPRAVSQNQRAFLTCCITMKTA